MRKRFLFLGALAAALALAWPARTQTGDPALRAVVAGADAYLLGAPERVAAGEVRRVDPSPDGRFVLAVREGHGVRPVPSFEKRAPREISLVWWSARGARSQVVWQTSNSDSSQAQVLGVGWLARSEAAFAVVHRTEMVAEGPPRESQTLLLVPASGAPARALLPLAGYVEVHPAPERSEALLFQQEGGSRTARLVRANGTGIDLPWPDDLRFFRWAADGKSVYAVGTGGARGDEAARWRRVTLPEGVVSVVPRPKEGEELAPVLGLPGSPLRLAERPAILTAEGKTTPLRSLWLEAKASPADEPSRALVAAEADRESALLLPEAALYRQQGALFARPLFRLDRAAFEAMQRAARKAIAINEAKQAGLALLMYAQDYDENFPGAEQLRGGAVAPYLKDADLLSRFRFTYAGPLGLGQIANPAETVLGYIPGPGGRAVVFVDGHVRWQDD